MIFDPNGPPGENWYFLAYFGIVPLEVDEYVLPMIEHLTFAVCFKTYFKKCLKTFLGQLFSGFFYYTFYHTTTLSSSSLLHHSEILHRVRATADDPGKDQSRRSGAKVDDLLSQSRRSTGQGRRYRPKRTISMVESRRYSG